MIENDFSPRFYNFETSIKMWLNSKLHLFQMYLAISENIKLIPIEFQKFLFNFKKSKLYLRILNWIKNLICISEISIRFQKIAIVFQKSQFDFRKSHLYFRILNWILENLNYIFRNNLTSISENRNCISKISIRL